VTIGDIDVTAVPVPHGKMTVYAYRIGPLAYVTDAKTIPPAAMEHLRGREGARHQCAVPDRASDAPEHSRAVRAAREIGADRTFLTHLTHDNFHADLEAELPRGVSPAFDGLTIRIDES
jgi:phosphoribosyl 1,2-cyclic phosphate phosphodiesterase